MSYQGGIRRKIMKVGNLVMLTVDELEHPRYRSDDINAGYIFFMPLKATVLSIMTQVLKIPNGM